MFPLILSIVPYFQLNQYMYLNTSSFICYVCTGEVLIENVELDCKALVSVCCVLCVCICVYACAHRKMSRDKLVEIHFNVVCKTKFGGIPSGIYTIASLSFRIKLKIPQVYFNIPLHNKAANCTYLRFLEHHDVFTISGILHSFLLSVYNGIKYASPFKYHKFTQTCHHIANHIYVWFIVMMCCMVKGIVSYSRTFRYCRMCTIPQCCPLCRGFMCLLHISITIV